MKKKKKLFFLKKKKLKEKEESESTYSIEEIDQIFSSLNLNNIKHEIKNERKEIKEKENSKMQNMVEEPPLFSGVLLLQHYLLSF